MEGIMVWTNLIFLLINELCDMCVYIYIYIVYCTWEKS